MNKTLQVTITLEDEAIMDLLEDNDIKPSKAKVNKLKKLFKEVEDDYYGQLEEALGECLSEIAHDEWGD